MRVVVVHIAGDIDAVVAKINELKLDDGLVGVVPSNEVEGFACIARVTEHRASLLKREPKQTVAEAIRDKIHDEHRSGLDS